MVLFKAEEGPFWNQLPKDKAKFKNTCKADWDRWVDEDEELDSKKLGGMADMMGGGGMGFGGGDMVRGQRELDFSSALISVANLHVDGWR